MTTRIRPFNHSHEIVSRMLWTLITCHDFFIMAYSLRKRSAIRIPQKYDDLDYHDHAQESAPKSASCPEETNDGSGYRGRVLDYNPSLRPAVFPTIPLDQEIEEQEEECASLPGESLQTSQHLEPSHLQTFLTSRIVRNDHPTDNQCNVFDLSSFHEPDMFNRPNADGCRSRQFNKGLTMSPSRAPSPNSLKKSNYMVGLSKAPIDSSLDYLAFLDIFCSSMRSIAIADLDLLQENKMYRDNMERMDKFSARTDLDWIMAEMETSDEDDGEAQKKREVKRSLRL